MFFVYCQLQIFDPQSDYFVPQSGCYWFQFWRTNKICANFIKDYCIFFASVLCQFVDKPLLYLFVRSLLQCLRAATTADRKDEETHFHADVLQTRQISDGIFERKLNKQNWLKDYWQYLPQNYMLADTFYSNLLIYLPYVRHFATLTYLHF